MKVLEAESHFQVVDVVYFNCLRVPIAVQQVRRREANQIDEQILVESTRRLVYCVIEFKIVHAVEKEEAFGVRLLVEVDLLNLLIAERKTQFVYCVEWKESYFVGAFEAIVLKEKTELNVPVRECSRLDELDGEG